MNLKIFTESRWRSHWIIILISALFISVLGCEDQSLKVDMSLIVEGGEASQHVQDQTIVDFESEDAAPVERDQEIVEIDLGPLLDMGQRLHSPREAPPSTQGMTSPSGLRWLRGVIHMHSSHSHDACDGDPRPNGVPNKPCLEQLRTALCKVKMDYILLTDHPTHFNEISFEEALLFEEEEGDVKIFNEQEELVGNQITCPNGDTVLVAPGSEGELMPVLLQRRPTDDRFYGDRSPESVIGLKEAGALVLHAHTEQRTFEELWPLGLDGFEIYNLHANVNPRGPQLRQVLPDMSLLINSGIDGPHPDLSLLAILLESDIALSIWDQFIAHRATLGFAGSDIHQNLPPLFETHDGERLDSYRRLMTWFSNYVLVTEKSLAGVRDALSLGRLAVVFHLLGEPYGLDFSLSDESGQRLEMGSETRFTEGLRLNFTPPLPPEGSSLSARVLRINSSTPDRLSEVNSIIVYEGSTQASIEISEPGAYRLEVRLTPEHLRRELGELADRFIKPMIWIYTNPIYIRAD